MRKNWPVKWQTLETKARFIQQVMNGQTSVRAAEDLDGGALTYAEIKAIASGNPAVMEKVKIDTEIRKLDQLRAVHLNQQHKHPAGNSLACRPRSGSARRESKGSPPTSPRRDANAGDEFWMTVGNREYSGKGARERLRRRSPGPCCHGATTRPCRCGARSEGSRS